MPQKFDLTPSLTSGIRARTETPRNAMVLKECTNLRTTPWGAKGFRAVNQPLTDNYLTNTAALDKTWPHPQIFRGKNASYLIGDTTSATSFVYTLTENVGSDWTVTSVGNIYKVEDLGNNSPNLGTLDTGGSWHFADFYDMVMFFNGSEVIFRSKASDYPTARWWVADNSAGAVPTVTTGAAFWEGRAILGGFNASDFFTTGWQSFFDTWVKNVPAHILAEWDYTSGPGQNWVWWSSIGGDDVLGLYSKDYMVYGAVGTPSDTGFGPDNPYYFELLMRNEAGFRPMPFTGTVQHIIPMGAFAIVYGTNGIAALQNTLNQVPEISLPTFGLHEMGLNTLGIASYSAAGGTDTTQLFIDEGGELWMVQGQPPQAQKLGYQEIFSNMLGNDIVISFDPNEQEFYISDGTDTYLYGRGGLSKSPIHPTTVSFAQGGLVGITYNDSEPTAVTIRTNTFDFGTREVKEIIDINVTNWEDDDDEWTCTVYYRFDNSSETAWSSVSGISLRDTGKVALRHISGVDFEFEFNHPNRSVAELDRVEVEVKVGGKQSFRRLLA